VSTHLVRPVKFGDRLLGRIPDPWRGGAEAVLTLVATVILSALLLRVFGASAAWFCSLLLIIVVIRAAWLGYGAGLMVCALTIFVVPLLLFPNRPHTVEPVRFALLVVILLLVSRVAAGQRRTEATLRSAAAVLEQRVAERTLELSEKQEILSEKAQLLDLSPDAILTRDPNGLIGFWSRGAAQIYGWTTEEAVGQNSHRLLGAVLPEPLPDIEHELLASGFWQGELKHTKRDGEVICVMSRWALRRDAKGEPCGVLEINTDVTGPRRVEEQLRHAQKLESVGLLAGGIAHDFNNLLTVINGYCEMLLSDVPADSPLVEGLAEIRGAGERAAGLTQQLLAFSRKQVVQPAALNLNLVVADIEKMLRRLIGEHIEVVAHLSPTLSNVVADAGQVQQIIVNLAVNARDAMPQGGTLLIETADIDFDEGYVGSHPEVQTGPYVMLAVTDTGTGIAPEVKARIFEPFFTTKPKGAGTGLGLATVYGMVRQSGGWIWVYSEPGKGTTFKLYFPRSGAPLRHVEVVAQSDLRGSETILVVEDQADVRGLAVAALGRYGYHVLAAANGAEAIAAMNASQSKIDLLLTDMVMPGIPGKELARQLTEIQPGLHVIFTSGYTETAIVGQNILDPETAYIQKPYTPLILADKVRGVLGPNGAAGSVQVVGAA
jgi:PAS domain S-box-containing protein